MSRRFVSQPSPLPRRSRLRLRTIVRTLGQAAIFGAMPLMISGCYVQQAVRSTFEPYQDYAHRSALKRKATKQAKLIWESKHASRHEGDACAEAYYLGFKSGFVETVLGNRGCPPPTPERPFLSCYSITNTYPAPVPWFNGYRMGHASAIACGADRWRFAPIDPELVQACCAETDSTPVHIEPIPVEIIEPELAPEPVPEPDLPPPAEKEPTIADFVGDIPSDWLSSTKKKNTMTRQRRQPTMESLEMDFN